VRIVFLVGTLERGGVERLVGDWCRRLRFQHECAVICLLGKRGPLVRELEHEGVPVFDFQRQPRDPRFLLSLASQLRQLKPDIVHTQCAWSLPQQTLAVKLGGVRGLVLTIHSHYGSAGSIASWRRLLGRKLSHRWINATVGVSRAVSSWSDAWLGLSPGSVLTIPNGVDISRFSVREDETGRARALKNLPSGKPLLLSVGNLTEQKDQFTLLRAVAQLRDNGLHATCLLAGTGPLLPNLQALAEELGIQGLVHFLGARGDIPDLMAAADVFVLSSIREGFSLVVAEAHAAGLPVVATNVGGIGEIVRDGLSGYLVEPRDPSRMAEVIVDLLADAKNARRMGAVGRDWVRQHFSIDRCAARYEELYQVVLEHEGSR